MAEARPKRECVKRNETTDLVRRRDETMPFSSPSSRAACTSNASSSPFLIRRRRRAFFAPHLDEQHIGGLTAHGDDVRSKWLVAQFCADPERGGERAGEVIAMEGEGDDGAETGEWRRVQRLIDVRQTSEERRLSQGAKKGMESQQRQRPVCLCESPHSSDKTSDIANHATLA